MKAENSARVRLIRMRYLMLMDLVCILLSITFSFAIRYEALIKVWPLLRLNWILFLVIPVVRLLVYYSFRLYRRMWRYASMKEFKEIVLAGMISSLLVLVATAWLLPVVGIPYHRSYSLLVLEGILSVALLGGTRFFLRLVQERVSSGEATSVSVFSPKPRRVLVAGAGDAGAMILRQI